MHCSCYSSQQLVQHKNTETGVYHPYVDTLLRSTNLPHIQLMVLMYLLMVLKLSQNTSLSPVHMILMHPLMHAMIISSNQIWMATVFFEKMNM